MKTATRERSISTTPGNSGNNDLASLPHSPRRYQSHKTGRLAKCTRTRKALCPQERTPAATLSMTIAAATQRPAQSQTTSGPTKQVITARSGEGSKGRWLRQRYESWAGHKGDV